MSNKIRKLTNQKDLLFIRRYLKSIKISIFYAINLILLPTSQSVFKNLNLNTITLCPCLWFLQLKYLQALLSPFLGTAKINEFTGRPTTWSLWILTSTSLSKVVWREKQHPFYFNDWVFLCFHLPWVHPGI